MHTIPDRSFRLALSLVCACLLLSFAAPAFAASPNAVLEQWSTHADHEKVKALYRDYDILLMPSRAWQDGEVADVLHAMQLLPKFVAKDLKGAKTRIERRPKACLYGMGRYSKACPTYSKDGRTFYLYNNPPVQGEGATRKLKVLRPDEVAKLMRQRAIVHMAMAHYDEKHEWSLTYNWRSINGWDRRGRDAFNLDVWGYSRYMGMQSAHLDLVTFAEEFFVRPQDILRNSKDPEAISRLAQIDWDLTLACQQFTKIRILGKFIAHKEPAWVQPTRGKPDAGPLGQCEEFERWADMQNVEGIDLLLAAATSDRPESLYGHLLLGVRYREGISIRSRGFEPVYQYGAITDTNVSKVDYFTKGLLGGFYSVIQPNTFRGVDRLFMQYEQRTLRRYALNLSPRQVRQVMERLWEAERHITFPYYFLSDNCASMLIDLVAPALDDIDVPNPFRLTLMPTEVLDLLAQTENGNRGPLLVKRAETHFSSREVAMDAVPRRRAALSKLEEQLEGVVDEAKIERLGELDEALDERGADKRRQAYVQLKEHLTTTLSGLDAKIAPEQRAAIHRHVIDYLYYSSRIERYFMDLAFYKRRIIHVSALKNPPQFTAEEQLLIRRELYMEEDLEKRQEAVLALARMSDQRLRTGERREFTEAEKAELAVIDKTQAAYLASLDTLATIIEAFEPDLDGVAFIETKREAFEADQRRRDRLSIGPPGKGRFIVGGAGGVQAEGGQSIGVGVGELSASLVYERLGEHRRRGVRSDISSRALGVDIETRLDDQWLDQLKLDLVLFEFMTIEQRMGPVRQNWRDIFGWGTRISAHRDGRRGLNAAIHAEFGYLYPLWQRDHVADFLVVGAWLSARNDWSTGDVTPLGGVKAAIMGQKHLYGNYANVLRLDLETYQFSLLDALGYEWEARARLQSEHALMKIKDQYLVLQPYLQAETSTLQYRPGLDRFGQVRGGVRFELPF